MNYGREEVIEIVKLLQKELPNHQQQKEEEFLSSLALTVMSGPEAITESIELIKSKYSDEVRILILAMVWKIILIDNRVDEGEKDLAFLIEKKLDLTSWQGEKARGLVIRRHEGW